MSCLFRVFHRRRECRVFRRYHDGKCRALAPSAARERPDAEQCMYHLGGTAKRWAWTWGERCCAGSVSGACAVSSEKLPRAERSISGRLYRAFRMRAPRGTASLKKGVTLSSKRRRAKRTLCRVTNDAATTCPGQARNSSSKIGETAHGSSRHGVHPARAPARSATPSTVRGLLASAEATFSKAERALGLYFEGGVRCLAPDFDDPTPVPQIAPGRVVPHPSALRHAPRLGSRPRRGRPLDVQPIRCTSFEYRKARRCERAIDAQSDGTRFVRSPPNGSRRGSVFRGRRWPRGGGARAGRAKSGSMRSRLGTPQGYRGSGTLRIDSAGRSRAPRFNLNNRFTRGHPIRRGDGRLARSALRTRFHADISQAISARSTAARVVPAGPARARHPSRAPRRLRGPTGRSARPPPRRPPSHVVNR